MQKVLINTNYQEAIDLLNDLLLKADFTDQYGDMSDSSLYGKAVDIAVKTIKKQMKQKVNYENHNSFNSCYCPVCKGFVGLDMYANIHIIIVIIVVRLWTGALHNEKTYL